MRLSNRLVSPRRTSEPRPASAAVLARFAPRRAPEFWIFIPAGFATSVPRRSKHADEARRGDLDRSRSTSSSRLWSQLAMIDGLAAASHEQKLVEQGREQR